MNNNNFHIRPANLEDIDFLTEAVLAADKGSGKVSSYSAVFNLSHDSAFKLIKSMMKEELDNCELSPIHFLIAEKNGQSAAAVSSWIEGSEGISSWMVRSALFQEYYPPEALAHAQKLKHIVNNIVVKRSPGTLQIESVYVHPKFRGNKFASLLIKEHAKNYLKKKPDLKLAELMTYRENIAAITLYQKMGFSVIQESHCKDSAVLQYYPGSGMVLMQIKIEKLLTG